MSFTNFNSAKKFVDIKIKQNHESLSGPGSHLCNTTETIFMISSVIKNRNIKTILDLGCGDWNWFRKITLNQCEYIGWDAHPEMIKTNIKKYGNGDGNKNITFELKDIVTEDYPKVDLIICRDVLFHLDKNLATKCLEKIKNSCKYFIATSFNDVGVNRNIHNHAKIVNWGFYHINLNIEPFNLEEYLIKSILEKRISNKAAKNRYINLYEFTKLQE